MGNSWIQVVSVIFYTHLNPKMWKDYVYKKGRHIDGYKDVVEISHKLEHCR